MKLKVYTFQVGHYRGLWGGPSGVVVAKNKEDAYEQLGKLCGSDESVRQLNLIPVSRRGVHTLERKGRE